MHTAASLSDDPQSIRIQLKSEYIVAKRQHPANILPLQLTLTSDCLCQQMLRNVVISGISHIGWPYFIWSMCHHTDC